MRGVLALLAIVALVGCASSGGSTTPANCTLMKQDSAYLAGGPVYRECAVDEPARRLNSIAPDFRPSEIPRSGKQCFSAQIEFVVDMEGMPEASTARLVRTNNPQYGEAVLAIVQRLRYSPASKDGVPVRQIVQHRSMGAIAVTQGGPPPRRPTC